MTEDDLIEYNIKNTDTYENKHISTLDLEEVNVETVTEALEEIASSTIAVNNYYTCIIADTEGNGEAGNWWGQTIVKYSSDYDKEAVLEESKATKDGLQQLLDNKKEEGYTSIKLLEGIYRIDHLEPIYISTEFTLDMNGATIKLNQFTGDSALMISLNNTFDSHVINGTIEGDYFSHDYANSENNFEWVNGISIEGESKYSSFENLVIKDITGYGGLNGIAKFRDGELAYTYIYPTGIGYTFKSGDIDRTNGEIIESTERSTSDFIDINGYDDVGYLSVNRYLGYQGNGCDTWNIIAHFYDKDQKYISSTDGYQYRRIEVPTDSKYLKVTILSDNYPNDLSIQYFRIPTHSTFKDIKFENCRAVGLAQNAMKDMLVENCEFTNSGQSSAKCAYDAEDGWDMMQDVTLRGLNFYDNPNNEPLTCAGHNFVIEDMKSGKVYIWERTNSYVFRNNNNITSANLAHSSRKRSGYARFYNNTVNGNITIGTEENDNWPFITKDSIINGRAENILNTGLYLRCIIDTYADSTKSNSALSTGNFNDCIINNKTGENMGGIYENCTFNNISGNMHGSFNISNSTINNWDTMVGSYEPTFIFDNCELNNLRLNFHYWHQGADILITNSIINNEDYLLKLPHYSMKKPITISNTSIISNSSTGLIEFFDDRTGGSAGELVKQSLLTIKNNNIKLANSEYLVTGINENTVNNINIIYSNNELSEKVKLFPEDSDSNQNIKILVD